MSLAFAPSLSLHRTQQRQWPSLLAPDTPTCTRPRSCVRMKSTHLPNTPLHPTPPPATPVSASTVSNKAGTTPSPLQLAAAAAAVSALLFSPLAVSASYPDTAPDALFFDEAAVVPRGQAGLAAKALDAIRERNGFSVHFVLPKSIPYSVSPSEYAQELFDKWNLGPADVVIVGGTKVARAGVVAGQDAAALLTPAIAESLGNETYAVKAGDELYGGAVLDVNNRLISVLGGEADPGPPLVEIREKVQTYKTKAETSSQRNKYIFVVGAVLAIAFIAPMIQTWWYIK